MVFYGTYTLEIPYFAFPAFFLDKIRMDYMFNTQLYMFFSFFVILKLLPWKQHLLDIRLFSPFLQLFSRFS